MAAYILLFSSLYALNSCHRKDVPVGVPESNSIELSASADSQSKAIISGVGDLAGDGFVVWASWEKDPLDEAIFTNDYASGATDLVFGANGTKVYATDGNGDGLFTPVQQILDTWYYTPKRYWQRGTYTFAAALPASFFNASHAMTDAEDTGKVITGVFADNTLTLDFGRTENGVAQGLDLATHQIDLMIACRHVDNTAEDASSVQLDFQKHQFSQIVIEAASVDEIAGVIVDEVSFYGNSRFTSGPMSISFDEDGNVTSDYALTNTSDSATPYKVMTDIGQTLPKAVNNGGENWQYTYSPIVNGLIVFPETCQMSMTVKYRTFIHDETVTSQQIEGTVTTSSPITWEAGMKYVYRLQISQHRVDIESAGVLEWNEKSIDHTFS